MKYLVISLCYMAAFSDNRVLAFTTHPRVTGFSLRQHLLASPPDTLLYQKDVASTLFQKVQSSRSSLLRLNAASSAASVQSSYYLVRILFLRALAFVYIFAFNVALRQNKGLIGDRGITPARNVLNQAEELGRGKRMRREKWWDQFKDTSSIPNDNRVGLFSILRQTKVGRKIAKSLNDSTKVQDLREVFWDRADRLGRPYISLLWGLNSKDRNENINPWLDRIALTGLVLSFLMFSLGAANIPLLLTLWVCQRSLMSVGGVWYGFGWEPQLAELTFHAMFLVPILSLDAIPYLTPVPNVTIWAMRWFLFRIMMGAGLIKLKSGDPKWKLKNLSTMDYFYETQPVPNPITKYFHAMPRWWHRFEVLINHFVELIAPWLLILPGLPRRWRNMGGLIQLTFQGVLISSGNLSFLNWLTMIPALFCFDDAFVSNLFPSKRAASALIASYNQASLVSVGIGQIIRKLANVTFGILIVRLSIPVVKNLLSKRQVMNGSFDPLRLVNTYGAFGSVDETREEYIIESAEHYSGPWKEYQFKVKPGNVEMKPRFISPYHYRLDWMMWIASSCGGLERSPWMYSLLLKLLKQEKDVLNLIETDPWQGSNNEKPKYIRVELYRYKFSYSGTKEIWERERIGRLFPKQGLCTEDQLENLAIDFK